MQMLQQFLGEQGARYAFYALTFIALLIVVLVLWVLIRKALGDRLNFSDKPDRRGRAPRLGITESFSVDRQGRRLVMVRRDNVEHLVMIGGPNDVVIETNVVRGERPVVGRSEQRAAEPELIPNLALQVSEPAPLPPQPAPVTSAPSPVSLAPARPLPPSQPLPPPTPQRAVSPPAATPEVKAPAPTAAAPAVATPVIAVPDAKSIAEKAKELAKVMAPIPAPDAAASDKPAAKPTMSFAERVKSSLPFGGASKAEKVVAAERTPDAPKTEITKTEVSKPEIVKPEIVKPEILKPAASVAAPAVDASAKPAGETEFRAKFEDMLRTKEPAIPPGLPPLPPVTQAPPVTRIVPPPPLPDPVVASASTAPPAPVMPKPPQAPAAPALAPGGVPPAAAPEIAVSAPAKVASKNPFDSLEEEMAKLLGRAPDGKG